MNCRENVLAVLDGEMPDRLSYRMSIGPDLHQRFAAEYGEDYHDQLMPDDLCHKSFWVRWPQVKYAENENGIGWQDGVLLKSLDEMDEYPFPDANDPVWYQDMAHAIETYCGKKVVVAMFPAILHTMDTFLGYDRFFMGAIDNPDQMHKLMERCCQVLETVVSNLCSMDIDILIIGDDISTESALMVSPTFLDEFVFPYDFRMLKIAKAAGKKVFFHTDGVIPDEITDRLIDAGFDGIHPMQPTCNNLKAFAGKYRDSLLVYGGLDNTQLIPRGTPDEIRRHILDLFEWFGNRIILSSSDFMGDAKMENILLVPEIIRKECGFCIQ